jgi:hypothetical protein
MPGAYAAGAHLTRLRPGIHLRPYLSISYPTSKVCRPIGSSAPDCPIERGRANSPLAPLRSYNRVNATYREGVVPSKLVGSSSRLESAKYLAISFEISMPHPHWPFERSA